MTTKRQWVNAFPITQLPAGSVKVYRGHGSQVAVFRLEDEQLFAVDNRCPHEGYPLAKGWVSDCLVTCPWHNFKFDLKDGRCVMGDEAVRTFDVQLDDGHVHLDLTPPDPSVEIPRLLASLEQGLLTRKLGQMARDVVRLLLTGVTPRRIAYETARLDAAYAQYGTTHATAVAVDALRLTDRYQAHEAVLPLMQALDMASETHRRRPIRPTPAAIEPSDDMAACGERLAQLVEEEKAEQAEALLRGAIAKGWSRETIEPWLYQLCADHFLDFGHALIYQVKLSDLLDEVGWSHAADLLPAQLFSIVNGTREELLPEWLWFRRYWQDVAPRAQELMATNGKGLFDADAAFAAICDGTGAEALDAVVEALEANADLERIVDVISAAAAERMLRFDVAIDLDPGLQHSWLDVTHTLTFAAALRQALRRWRDPDALRLVLFAVRFVNVARPLDGTSGQRDACPPPQDHQSIMTAIGEGRADRAMALTEAYLQAERPVEPLRVALEDLCLADPLTRPIVVAHAIKTCVAAFDEHRDMVGPRRGLPVLAVVRLLASPIVERRVARAVHEAVRFVVHGKVPKTLT